MSDEVNALRQQLKQLAQLHADGALDEAAYQDSRARLERRLLDAVMRDGPAAGVPATPRVSTRFIGVLAAVAVLAAAVGYLAVDGARRDVTTGATPGATPEAMGLPATSAAPGAAQVSGRVTLAAELAGKARPDDTVFIFARAAGADSSMPLAVLRKQVRDLPLDYTLDDSLAMTPSATLANVTQVVVTARISRSGDAMPQAGDLSGQSAAVAVGARDVQITIDRIVGHP